MGTLWIQILPGSDRPIYRQVVEQVGEAIARGRLSVGDKLPAVRKLAAELVINPNTVARAYTTLEQQGLVVTKSGSGTFISDPKLRDRDAADVNAMTERFDNLITRGLNLGFSSTEMVNIFKNRLAAFADKPESEKK